MVDQKTALAELVRSFPQLSSSQIWTASGNHDRQWFEFARLLSGLYHRRDYESVRASFDHLERFLAEGNSYVRGWVTGFLQFLQDVTCWSTPNSDAFMGGADVPTYSETVSCVEENDGTVDGARREEV